MEDQISPGLRQVGDRVVRVRGLTQIPNQSKAEIRFKARSWRHGEARDGVVLTKAVEILRGGLEVLELGVVDETGGVRSAACGLEYTKGRQACDEPPPLSIGSNFVISD